MSQTYTILAKYVRMKDADVHTAEYDDGSLALIAEAVDDEGFPDRETLSINLSAYGLYLPEGHVFVREYSEHEGLPAALERAGVGVVVARFGVGPFDSPAASLRLTLR